MVGRHKINGPSKQIVVENDLVAIIEAKKRESVSKKIRKILQENTQVEDLKSELSQEKTDSEKMFHMLLDLQNRINFSRKPGARFPYPPWSTKHRTIGASFCLLIPHDEYGNHLAFNLVYSDKCLECNDGKCRYDAKDLVYYCKTNTRQVNGIHDKGVDDIVYWW